MITKKRKSISPLISTILLVVVCVVIVIIILNFSTNLSQESLSNTTSKLTENTSLIGKILEERSFEIYDKAYVVLRNTSNESLTIKSIKILDEDDNSMIVGKKIDLNQPIDLNSNSSSQIPIYYFPSNSFDLQIIDDQNRYTTVKVTADKRDYDNYVYKKDLILDLPLQEPYTEASDNLVSNGRFDTDTDWSKGAGWTINDGKASIDGSQTGPSYLIPEPNVYIEANKKYFLSLSIPDCSSSYLRFRANDEILNTPNITSSGEFSFVFSSKYSGVFKIEASGLFIGSIDNVIIKELNGTVKDRTPNQNNGTVSGATLKHDGLVNTSNGVAYIPSETAYGSWEFNFRLGSGGNHYISFIDTNNTGSSGFTGYYLLFNSSNRIYLAKANAGGSITYMCNTANNYVALDTDYRINIIRSLAGNFVIYIKGGDYGWDDWTLVSTVGGAGTNPITDNTYTTSNYFVTDLHSGDQISNLKINNNPISLAEATQSTGTWTTTAPSYEFDGTDDYIDLGADKPTDLTGDITISAWINPKNWGVQLLVE